MYVWVCSVFIVLVSNNRFVDCVTKTSVPIGGIFYDDDQSSAFEHALWKRTTENLKFMPRTIRPKALDTYTTLKEVCKNTKTGRVAALLDGGELSGSCNALCQLCSKISIPQMFVTWRPPEATAYSIKPFGLSYHPQPSLVSKAYAALIKFQGLTKFTFLYENGDGILRIQEVLKSRHVQAESVMIRRLQPYGDNKILFKELASQEHFVVDCQPDNINKYLNELLEVNNHTEYQSYIFTSLDSHTVDLKMFKNFFSNVSTLHMTDRHDPFWVDVRSRQMDSLYIRLETALAADAATHISIAIESLIRNNSGEYADLPTICQRKPNVDYVPWENGTTLLKEMQQTVMTGLSGNIEFSEKGYRQNFKLLYSVGRKDGFTQVGYWDSSTDLLTITNSGVNQERYNEDTSGEIKVLKVVSRIGKPYFGRANVTGEFEGFAVDLIDAIFKKINNTAGGRKYAYEFYQAAENSYGNMIKDLTTHNADLAICDLTMTSERQRTVDFSVPFMSLGISILIQAPPKEEPKRFSFIEPLALDLWLYLITAYFIVSFVLLICARMSQEDWVNPHPCNRNPEALENIWDLYNCTWLSMGTIMTQGCDILPRAAGSRLVTGMWWFFALIITASYTANMSTFLSNDMNRKTIESAKDLAEQNKITYGTVEGQSTYKFFKTSNDSVYSKIFSVMESTKPKPYTDDNNAGRDRVATSKNKFAFFMESTTIEYYVERNCDLQMIGGKLDSKEYGIAMPRNSPLRQKIDLAILELQENSAIEKLKEVWWEKRDNGGACKERRAEEERENENGDSLQMKNTSGIFLVLFAGGVLGTLYALLEFILHAHKIAVKENLSWKEAIITEWRASLDPRVLSKPVAPPRSLAPSTASSTPDRGRSTSRAVSVLKAAQSFINLDKVY